MISIWIFVISVLICCLVGPSVQRRYLAKHTRADNDNLLGLVDGLLDDIDYLGKDDQRWVLDQLKLVCSGSPVERVIEEALEAIEHGPLIALQKKASTEPSLAWDEYTTYGDDLPISTYKVPPDTSWLSVSSEV